MGGRPRSEAARTDEAPTGTGGVTPPQVDSAPQANTRASPTPPALPPANTRPKKAPSVPRARLRGRSPPRAASEPPWTSSRLDTCRAPAPRFRAADSGAPPPVLSREPRRRGGRPRGSFTFLPLSPAAEARGALTPPPASLSHPRRRQENPAAQPTLDLTWFKSSLSQDTHSLPGPPPRSRCHR
ncbi:nascent polypeptide-associated complex subunit alpha, muscle-specific form-like [Mastomys coucha]|uniref:nascent polypeptide-associated complex subunit alpha, muscle-specific form-like n=1 Tax=Mastomys coucha TaxID=35658 RepID=UPI0012624868|nr:nascent polypeptide-associated complex subunit alpha, muscle-specific form-like [Mastomys coucha]